MAIPEIKICGLSTPETVTEVGDNLELTQGGQPIYVWMGREDELSAGARNVAT